jgi:hypothetical protein
VCGRSQAVLTPAETSILRVFLPSSPIKLESPGSSTERISPLVAVKRTGYGTSHCVALRSAHEQLHPNGNFIQGSGSEQGKCVHCIDTSRFNYWASRPVRGIQTLQSSITVRNFLSGPAPGLIGFRWASYRRPAPQFHAQHLNQPVKIKCLSGWWAQPRNNSSCGSRYPS